MSSASQRKPGITNNIVLNWKNNIGDVLILVCSVYTGYWRNTSVIHVQYVTKLAPDDILSPSNKVFLTLLIICKLFA
jgi:hypothetical protein